MRAFNEGLLSLFLGIRRSLPFSLRIALGAVPVALVFLGWWAVTAGSPEARIISPVILPSPFEVAHSAKSLWFEAQLSRSILASALRVVGGFAVALAIAFPLGILMGSFSGARALFSPLMLFGSYLPIPTLVPLTLSLFGIGDFQKVMFLSLAFLVFLLPMFVKALDDVDEVYLQTAQTLGASRWQLMRRVLLGASMVRIFQAMRLGFGIGWTYIILAEMVAADRGLGQIIIVAQRRGPREHIYLVLVVIVLIAYATDMIWRQVGRQLFPYREDV